MIFLAVFGHIADPGQPMTVWDLIDELSDQRSVAAEGQVQLIVLSVSN
jgi:hypothetical protein